jgi:PBSX family phage terminase large subunit
VTLAPDALPMSPRQIRSIVEADGRINVWSGAISSGKTVASLLRWLAHVADAPRGGDLLMVGKTLHTLARNVFGPLTNPDLFGPLADHVRYTSGAPTANILGRTVHVLGANDSRSEHKIRGFTASGAYIDECTLLPGDAFQQIIGRLRVPGAKLFATTNPDNPAHWLRKDFLLANDPDIRSWHFTLDDNPWLDPAYVAAIKRQFTGLWYKRFILGQWVAAEGSIYDGWDPQRHVVDAPAAIRHWIAVGVDYGTANPFCALLLGVGTDGRLTVASEHWYDGKKNRRAKTDVEYSTDLRAWLAAPPEGYTPVQVPWICVDPSAASFTAQLYRDGLRPVPAENAVTDGIRLVASLLAADKLRVSSTCTHLIEELAGYVWDPKAALAGIDQPLKVADHAADALRYAIATTEGTWRPWVGNLAAAA